MDVSKSFHLPEKGAIVGADQCPSASVETMIMEPLALPRVKKTAFPSGVNAGERSSAGPDITPGANSLGLLSAAWARHAGEVVAASRTSPAR
jgi:hypothetical protein